MYRCWKHSSHIPPKNNKALFAKFVAFVRKKSAFGFFTAYIPVAFKRKIYQLHGKRAQ
jgi:hypothetical protein